MLTFVGMRKATDTASMIERRMQAPRQPAAFIAIQTTTGPLEVRALKFIGKVVIGETPDGQIVMIPLGEETLRDAHRPTLIVSTKST